MKGKHRLSLQRHGRQSLVVGGVLVALALGLGGGVAGATTGDIGYRDGSFTGSVKAPTSDKPQSKLWYNDGLWWADMFDPTSKTWHIFRLDRSNETWVDTGTRIDDRSNSLADTLWDGSHLYVASHYVTVSTIASPKVSQSNKPARLYRYTYSPTTKTYSLDPGYPSQISNFSSESLTIDEDSTGVIWATWTQVSGSASAGFTSAVYVNNTSGTNSKVWGTPRVMPTSGATASADDISAVVAYSGSRIGVMWSNENDNTMYWAWRNDTENTSSWHGGVAVRGNKLADDHMNLKTLQADNAGRVFAAVKTSLDEITKTPKTDPQLNLLVFKPGTGSWSSTMVGTVSDCHTRPLVLLDSTNQQVHVFATAPTASGCPFSGAPGSIYEKSAPLDNPVFPAGRGTPVIRDAASAEMNNVTSTKQTVNATTGLVILASNDSTDRYWHADLPLGAPTAPTSSFTASATSGVAPLTVHFTDTSTGGPTSWSWAFGDGSTSTAQNPSVTYTQPGTYQVTMTASNAGGAGQQATTVVTVDQATGGSGIRRESVSTTEVTTAANGITINQPSGTSAGDLLVSCVTLNGSYVTPSGAPAGWSPIASATSISNPKVYGYYKVATASEPASYHWTFGGSITSSGGIARYSGTSGPDGNGTVATGASASTATVPGVTTTAANDMLVGCMGINSGSATLTITGPPGTTAAWDLAGKRSQLDDGLQPAAGFSGGKSWTFSSGREWAGWLVALRPL
jgi:hypothetical protein